VSSFTCSTPRRESCAAVVSTPTERESPISWASSISSHWPPSPTWCRSSASTAPTSRRGCR
jgi:hypothetical protein